VRLASMPAHAAVPALPTADGRLAATPVPMLEPGFADMLDPFVREELAKTHLKADVTCIACHGVSNRHANDENIGATKPDVVFQRDEVNASCRTCHPTHDVPPEAVIARWLERKLTKSPPVCTDCHGSHRIGRPPADPASAEDPTEAPGGGTQGTEKAPG